MKPTYLVWFRLSETEPWQKTNLGVFQSPAEARDAGNAWACGYLRSHWGREVPAILVLETGDPPDVPVLLSSPEVHFLQSVLSMPGVSLNPLSPSILSKMIPSKP